MYSMTSIIHSSGPHANKFIARARANSRHNLRVNAGKKIHPASVKLSLSAPMMARIDGSKPSCGACGH